MNEARSSVLLLLKFFNFCPDEIDDAITFGALRVSVLYNLTEDAEAGALAE